MDLFQSCVVLGLGLLRNGIIYLLGYAFSLVGGRVGAGGVAETVEVEGGGHYSTEIVGLVETAIYTTAWVVDKELFIPVWLGLKVSTHWKVDNVKDARPIFNRWLAGSGTALGYGVVGGVAIKSALANQWATAIGLPVVLSLATVLMVWRGRALKRRNPTPVDDPKGERSATSDSAKTP